MENCGHIQQKEFLQGDSNLYYGGNFYTGWMKVNLRWRRSNIKGCTGMIQSYSTVKILITGESNLFCGEEFSIKWGNVVIYLMKIKH